MEVAPQPGVQDATCRSLVAALCRKIAGSGSEASDKGMAWEHACHRRLMDTAFTILLDLTLVSILAAADQRGNLLTCCPLTPWCSAH